jgi:DNA-directed RNA polymerase delta subunit
LELENNKTYCETIQEFLIIFYTELFKDSKFIKIVDCDCKLLDDIKLLLLNNSEYPSFTNKIKFKLMNIRDKYEVLSNS